MMDARFFLDAAGARQHLHNRRLPSLYHILARTHTCLVRLCPVTWQQPEIWAVKVASYIMGVIHRFGS